MAKGPRTSLVYHLPQTVVCVRGTATTKNILGSPGDTQVTAKGEFLLEPRSDADHYYKIDFTESSLSDSEMKIVLAGDGRLISTDATTTGKLGTVVRSVFGFVASAAALAAKAAAATAFGALAPPMLALGPAAPTQPSKPGKDPVEVAYKKAHPEMAAKRGETRDAIDKLEKRILAVGTALAGQAPKGSDVDGKSDEELRKMLSGATAALTALRAEAEKLNTHFKAWKSSAEDEKKESFTHTVELSVLPTVSEVKALQSALAAIPPDDPARTDKVAQAYRTHLGEYEPVFQAARAIVAMEDPFDRSSDSGRLPHGVEGLANHESYHGIVFRQARPVTLELHVEKDDAFTLAKRDIVFVVDRHSRLGFVELGSTKWSKKSAKVEMGPGGELKTLSNASESAAAAAASALAQLPEEALARLKQANAIIDEGQQLALQGIDFRISTLEQRKKLIDAEIAHAGVLATREDVEEKARLKAEIERLEAVQTLTSVRAAGELGAETAQIRREIELLTLRVELREQELARLRAEFEIQKLTQGSSP